jgi:hypothetical protein
MNTATAQIEAKAIAKVKALSTEMLCEVFEGTNKIHGLESAAVRGWVMDELESRDPEAFGSWMDCEDVDCMDFPSRFFS